MYVDAAEWKSTYMVGVWADNAGARLWEAPPTVWNLQAAELLGVEKAVKMAAYRGMKELNLGVDNLAAVWAVLNRRLKIHHRDRATMVHRIQQTLRWSGMALRLTYVPSRWNPADSISRIFKWSNGLRAVIEARACSQVLRMLQWAPCSDMGSG